MTTYFDRYEFPDQISHPWLAERVPTMSDREWAVLLYVLGSRGWTADELAARVFGLRFP